MRFHSNTISFFIPNFVKIQKESFSDFLQKGLIEEISNRRRIKKLTHPLDLVFYPEYYQLNFPEHTPTQAVFLGKTYSSKLYVPVELSNRKTKKRELKWAFLGKLPLMTKRGHFIINGSPRVIVNQLIRSPGIYYNRRVIESKKEEPDHVIVWGDFIPQRGAWLRLKIDKNGIIWIKLKKLPKIPIFVFLRALGVRSEETTPGNSFLTSLGIMEVPTKEKPNEPTDIEEIARDNTGIPPLEVYAFTSREKGFSSLYQAAYPKNSRFLTEKQKKEKGRKFLFRKFQNPKTYNLSKVGRNRLNNKLGVSVNENKLTLTKQDVVNAARFLVKLQHNLISIDDIDNLKNRRVRTSGELLRNQFNVGLNRLEKEIKEIVTRSGKKFKVEKLILPKKLDGCLREFFGLNPLSQYMDQTNPLAEITHKRRISLLGPGGVKRANAMQVRSIHPTYYGRICPIETPEGQNAGLVNSLTIYSEINSQGFLQTPFHKIYQGQVQQRLGRLLFSAKQEETINLAPGDLQLSVLGFLGKQKIPIKFDEQYQKASSNKVEYACISPLQMISVATSLIPFLEHDDANRALMGSNMQRQAVPVLSPELPIVGTGLEGRVVADSGHLLQSKTNGFVLYASSEKIKVQPFLNLFSGSGKTKTIAYSAKKSKSPRQNISNISSFGGQRNSLRLTETKLLYPKLEKRPIVEKIASKKTHVAKGIFQTKSQPKTPRSTIFLDKSKVSAASGNSGSIVGTNSFSFKGLRKRLSPLVLVASTINANSSSEQLALHKVPTESKAEKSDFPAFGLEGSATGVLAKEWKSGKFLSNTWKKRQKSIQKKSVPVSLEQLVQLGSYLYTEKRVCREKSKPLNTSQLLKTKKDCTDLSLTKQVPDQTTVLKISSCNFSQGSTPICLHANSVSVDKGKTSLLSSISFLFGAKQANTTLQPIPIFHQHKLFFKNRFASKTFKLQIKKKIVTCSINQDLEHKNQILNHIIQLYSGSFEKVHKRIRKGAAALLVSTLHYSAFTSNKKNDWVLLCFGFRKSVFFKTKKNGSVFLKGFSFKKRKQKPQVKARNYEKKRFSYHQKGLQNNYYQNGFLDTRTGFGLSAHFQETLSSYKLEKMKNISFFSKHSLFLQKGLNLFTPSWCWCCLAPTPTPTPVWLKPIEYRLQKYERSNQKTCLVQRPGVKEGEWVQKGDLLANSSSSVSGELALGKNVLVAYMPWEGYNFEDAILISERLVYDDVFTSIHIQRYRIAISETTFGIEQITNVTNDNRLRIATLEDNGIIKTGSWVKEGDVLVRKLHPVDDKRSLPYQKLMYDILNKPIPITRERSLRVPKNVEGRVIKTQIVERQTDPEKLNYMGPARVHVYLAEKRKIQVGDKMSGRHGNKGIVSRILPRQDMPFLPNGMPIDIVLNPLGVPSRMNVGQVFESLLGLAGINLNQQFKILPFDELYGSEASRTLVYSKLYQARLKTGQDWLFNPENPGKTFLFDGRTGQSFDQSVTVGQAYMLKLIHLVADKIHARSTGPYSLITQQPVKGRSKHGGQRVGEMEVWALEGFGVAYTLYELLTVKSDDVKGRHQIMDHILKRKPIELGRPASFRLLIRELQSLCVTTDIYQLPKCKKT